ncbi:MAG: hypothetical protein Q9169_005570, partial [Polycauliona sp. 2 TL-2023]
MTLKRKCEGRTQTKESELQRKVDSRTWNQFLHTDARNTQKAFVHWYFNTFLPSARGQELSKCARRELQDLISKPPLNTINRNGILDETLEVIRAWENEPIPLASIQWRLARIRLIADLLLRGTLSELQNHPLLSAPTQKEVNQARCWIYRHSNATFVRYQSLAQPWCTKEIPWPYHDITQIKLADPSKALESLPTAWTITSLSDVRISSKDFDRLIEINNGGVRPGEYNDGGVSIDDFSDSDEDEERWANYEEVTPNGRVKRIKDWVELTRHSTRGCVDEGWLDLDMTDPVMPDIEVDSKGIDGAGDAKQASRTPTPIQSPSIQWTPINRP